MDDCSPKFCWPGPRLVCLKWRQSCGQTVSRAFIEKSMEPICIASVLECRSELAALKTVHVDQYKSTSASQARVLSSRVDCFFSLNPNSIFPTFFSRCSERKDKQIGLAPRKSLPVRGSPLEIDDRYQPRQSFRPPRSVCRCEQLRAFVLHSHGMNYKETPAARTAMLETHPKSAEQICQHAQSANFFL